MRLNKTHMPDPRIVTTFILVVVFLGSLLFSDWGNLLSHGGGGAMIRLMGKGLISLELSYDFILLALEASLITLAYAVCAISVAVSFGFIGGLIASGGLFSSIVTKLSAIVFFRALLAVVRSIHELIWAWLIALALGFTPMSGILALAIPYSAILARVYADFLNDVPEPSLQALRTSGATPLQVMLYGRIPAAAKEMVSYGFYRFECCIRSASVLSFIGLQGLGYQIGVSLDDLLFAEVWTLLLFLVGLIILVDYWGSTLRRFL